MDIIKTSCKDTVFGQIIQYLCDIKIKKSGYGIFPCRKFSRPKGDTYIMWQRVIVVAC